MACDPQSLLNDAACLRCVPPWMLPAIKTWELCQLVNKPSVNCDPLALQLTQSWSDRVVINSGNPLMRPSVNTFNAVHTFLCTLITNNLHTRMMTMSVLPPDNIWACITPVLNYGAGVDPWVVLDCEGLSPQNPDTTVFDLSLDGLRSNGPLLGSFVLDSGYITDPLKVNHGMTGIVFEHAVGPSYPGFIWIGGAVSAAIEALELQTIFPLPGGYTLYTAFDESNILPANLGRISITPVPGTADGLGFFSMSRRSNIDFEAYFSEPGSGFPFLSVGNKNGISGTPPNISIWFFGRNPDGFCTDARFSFVSAHLGYTTAETLILFNAVQQLRHDLGGGWV